MLRSHWQCSLFILTASLSAACGSSAAPAGSTRGSDASLFGDAGGTGPRRAADGSADVRTVGGGDSGSSRGSDGGSGTGTGSGSGTGGGSGSGTGSGSGSSAGSGSGTGTPSACNDGGCVPPSCAGLAATCGPQANESCCASSLVTGGTFDRSYDAVTYQDSSSPATVSTFRLDRFKVTVGRFRPFVAALAGGWLPAVGSGKHTHLNGGAGLNGGTEPGWSAAWSSALLTTSADWDAAFAACSASKATWTSSPGANEDRPINCVNWEDAVAFCVWDGGFMPTEAEWNYAAAGGAEQRVYPWSSPATSATVDGTYASYNCLGDGTAGCALTDLTVVGSKSPLGDGKWGQADLAGDVWEWNLDWFLSSFPMPCHDCAAIQTGAVRAQHGGAWNSPAQFLLTSYRYNQPTGRQAWNGARCARVP